MTEQELDEVISRLPRELTPAQRRRLHQRRREWAKALQPISDAIRRSQIITGDDLAIRINVRDTDV